MITIKFPLFPDPSRPDPADPCVPAHNPNADPEGRKDPQVKPDCTSATAPESGKAPPKANRETLEQINREMFRNEAALREMAAEF
jgi:hypothetical protein